MGNKVSKYFLWFPRVQERFMCRDSEGSAPSCSSLTGFYSVPSCIESPLHVGKGIQVCFVELAAFISVSRESRLKDDEAGVAIPKMSSVGLHAAQFDWLTSVHRMTFPFALYSEPWNIFTLVIDSIDLPSIGLTTLWKGGKRVRSDSEGENWTEKGATENSVGGQTRCRRDLPCRFATKLHTRAESL